MLFAIYLEREQVVFVANLKPVKIRGIVSKGMILTAGDDEALAVLIPEKKVESGSKIE